VTGDDLSAFILTIISGLVLLFSALVGGVSSKWSGRKTILLVGEIICASTLTLLGIFSVLKIDVPIIIFTFLYEIAFGFSLGPITWLYVAEILPEKGVSIATLFNWVCVSIIFLLFPVG